MSEKCVGFSDFQVAPSDRGFECLRTAAAMHYGPEELQQKLANLAYERERLREAGKPRTELERNRLEIVRCQQQLSRSFIQLYLPDSTYSAA